MNKMDIVKTKAEEILEWAMEMQEEFGDLCDWSEDLCGLCAICSYKLFIELKSLDINCYVVGNAYHCFNIVDQFIVDITAGQFKGDFIGEVAIVPKHLNINEEYYWEDQWMSNDNNEIYDHFSIWPTQQNPFSYEKYIGAA